MNKKYRDLNRGISLFHILVLFSILFICLGKIPYSDKINCFVNEIHANVYVEIKSSNHNISKEEKAVYKANEYLYRITNKNGENAPSAYLAYENDNVAIYNPNWNEYDRLLVYKNDPDKVYYRNVLVWDGKSAKVDSIENINPSIMNANYIEVCAIKDDIQVYKEPSKDSEVITKINNGFKSDSFKNGMYNDEFWSQVYIEELNDYGWICGKENIIITKY